MPVFKRRVWDEPLNSGVQNLAASLKNRDIVPWYGAKTCFNILEPLGKGKGKRGFV